MSQWRDDELYHAFFKRKSKYKGGFVKKGKKFINTSAYNHDYYINNKIKWLFNQGRIDEETYLMMLLMPKNWDLSFLKNVSDFVKNLWANLLNEVASKEDEVEEVDTTPEEFVETEKKERPQVFFDKTDDAYSEYDSYENEFENRAKNSSKSSESTQAVIDKELNKAHKYRYKVYEDGKWRYFYTDAEYYSFLDDVPHKGKHDYSVSEDMSLVNPNFDEAYEVYEDFLAKWNRNEETDEDWDRYYESNYWYMNCPDCTLAYDLRRRGYDVSAGANDDGHYLYEISNWYENADMEPVNNEEAKTRYNKKKDTDYFGKALEEYKKSSNHNLFKNIAKNENGSSGFLTVYWEEGGGHCMAWQVIDNQAYVLDCQTNTAYTEEEFYNDLGHRVVWDPRDYSEYDMYKDEVVEDLKPHIMRTDDKILSETARKTAYINSNSLRDDKSMSNDDWLGDYNDGTDADYELETKKKFR